MRYVAIYGIDCTPELDENDIPEINEIFKKDENFNPMINKVFHDCVKSRLWDDVPLEMDEKITGWNWFILDKDHGIVEILSTEELTKEELAIMEDNTEGQISDGYNENPFVFKLPNGHSYNIMFHEWSKKGFE